jgi:hypothetical protein
MGIGDYLRQGRDYLKTDHLENLSPPEVRDWYLRLAEHVDRHKGSVKESLASKFLKYYINGGGADLIFDPPDHLLSSKFVKVVLDDHRAWFLTKKKFKDKWVGVVPRLQEHKYTPNPDNPLLLWIGSNCEIPVDDFGKLSDGDKDLATSLHGFLLVSFCTLFVNANKVTFQWWASGARDRYDFDSGKWFRVPNPDYKNPFHVSNPVAPDDDEIVVFHKNAIRMEKAGLAKPYDLASNWLVLEPSITGVGLIDPNQQLSYAPWQHATHPPLRWT